MSQLKLAGGLVVVICAGLLAFAPASAAKSVDDQRDEIRQMSQQVLQQLYAVQPGAGKAIERSAVYAVFSNFGTKILMVGGGAGKGLAVNRRTKSETIMKMVELQTGLGFGIKKFSLVWVFVDQAALDRFVNSGWEFGGQVSAAAEYAGEGSNS